MKIAFFDSGDPEIYYNNPNLRWGEPAYLLEPGDPGYVDLEAFQRDLKPITLKRGINSLTQNRTFGFLTHCFGVKLG